MVKTIIRKKAESNYRLFAICPGGLDEVLKNEIESLGAKVLDVYAGGVEFEGNLEMAYRACLCLRTASRVLLLLKDEKQIFQPEELYEAVRSVDWVKVFSPNCTFAVYFTETNNKARKNNINLQFWALKAKDAIADYFNDRFGERPNVDRHAPDISIKLHLHNHILKIYLDLSGRSLHERGYRNKTLEAPIKENLAAGLLLLSGWDKKAKQKITFLDPFCGSGTLLIEAAMIASNTPPSIFRTTFGFYSWRDHVPSIFEKVRESLISKIDKNPEKMPLIFGSDQNPEALAITQQNLKNCQLDDVVKLQVLPFEFSKPPTPTGLIVTNPPYGVRLNEVEALKTTYQKLGSTLKHEYKGWNCGVITSEDSLFHAIALKPSKKWKLHNGSLESEFRIYEMF
jgi:23S rRNA (guanine2445-N2)-methyltransferase / 23S rRNA (guanine2069-N7)-methyltransferase